MKYSKLIILPMLALLIGGCDTSSGTSEVILDNVTSIEIKTLPEKLNYVVGETFVPDGLVIRAIDGETSTFKDISYLENKTDFTFSPTIDTQLSLEDSKVTVIYREKETSFGITVKEAEPDVVIEGDLLDYVKTKVLTDHNYTAHIKSRLVGDNEDFTNYSIFNINNDAIFDDAYGSWYHGYIRQKDQGIVAFSTTSNTSNLVVGHFMATNPTLALDEFYELAIENLFSVSYTQDPVQSNCYISPKYSKTNRFSAMAILANMAVGDYVIYTEAPEYYDIVVAKNGKSFTFNAVFSLKYVPTDTSDITVESVDCNFSLTVSDLGETHFENIEAYVNSPDYHYVAPTEWSSDDIEIFNEKFNNTTPPFITNLSYASRVYLGLINGKYYPVVEDLASGNLTASYAVQLLKQDYDKVDDNTYTKTIINGYYEESYSVEMSYIAPTDLDSDGLPYGDFFPNGKFNAVFKFSRKFIGVINTVALLNEYIKNSAIGDFFPAFNLPDDAIVADFLDSTPNYRNAAFVSPHEAGYFKIYIPSYEDAVALLYGYASYFASKGMYLQGDLGTFAFGSMSDEYSAVIFGDIVFAGKANYKGYIQMQIRIYNQTLDRQTGEDDNKELVGLSISGYKTEYYLNEEFVFRGDVTAYYSDSTIKIVTNEANIPQIDTSTPGEKEVIISYTENGVTKEYKYTITVSEAEEGYYKIYTDAAIGTVITISSPSSLIQKAGEDVIFKVQSTNGYTIESIHVTYSGGDVDFVGPNFMTKAYNFAMPEGDVTISTTATRSSSEPIELSGTYTFVTLDGLTLKMIFDGSGDGQIEKYRTSSGNLEATGTFKYTYNESNYSVTINNVNYQPTQWGKYRIVPTNGTNTTGVVNPDGSFTLMMYDYQNKGSYQTFTK